jgi:hypothetical protein
MHIQQSTSAVSVDSSPFLSPYGFVAVISCFKAAENLVLCHKKTFEDLHSSFVLLAKLDHETLISLRWLYKYPLLIRR